MSKIDLKDVNTDEIVTHSGISQDLDFQDMHNVKYTTTSVGVDPEGKICNSGESDEANDVEKPDKNQQDIADMTSDVKVDPFFNEQSSDTLEEDLVLKWDDDDLDIEENDIAEDTTVQTLSSESNQAIDSTESKHRNDINVKISECVESDSILNISDDQSSEQKSQEGSSLIDTLKTTSSPEETVNNSEFINSTKEATADPNSISNKTDVVISSFKNDEIIQDIKSEEESSLIDIPKHTSSPEKTVISEFLNSSEEATADLNSILNKNDVDISSSKNDEIVQDIFRTTEHSNETHESKFCDVPYKNVTVKKEAVNIQEHKIYMDDINKIIFESDSKHSNDNISQIATPPISDYDKSTDNSTITVNTDHQLHKPDVMIEIPSEESKMDITEFIENNREISEITDLYVELGDIPEGKTTNTENHDHSEKGSTELDVIIDSDSKENKCLDIEKKAIKDMSNHSLENIQLKDEVDEKLKVNEELTAPTSENMSKTEFHSQPSTSLERFGHDDELLENTDSLGLLAESSRVMDDDEDLEEDDDIDDGEEEDFDQDDESSNQMTAEHSEDSNAPQSETETPKELISIDTDHSSDVKEKVTLEGKQIVEEKHVKLSQEVEITEDGNDISLPKETDNTDTASLQTIKIDDKVVESQQKVAILVQKDVMTSKEGLDCGLQLQIENVMSEVPLLGENVEMEVDDMEQDNKTDVTEILESNDELNETETVVEEEMEQVNEKAVVDDRMEITEIPLTETADIEVPTVETPPAEAVEIEPFEKQLDTDLLQNSEESLQGEVQQPCLLKVLLEKSLSNVSEITSPVRKKGRRSPKQVADEVISCSINLESSSEDEMQDGIKLNKELEPSNEPEEVTCVNIPNDIEIMSSGAKTCDIQTKEGEVVISGVPKPKLPHKPARLNTSEVTIKTTSAPSESTLVIPEAKIDDPTCPKDDKNDKPKPTTRLSLEVFSLDSDDEEVANTTERDPLKIATSPAKKHDSVKHETNTCINFKCKSGGKEPFFLADSTTIAYYESSRKANAVVCLPCAEYVSKRMQGLLEGIKNMTPLLELDFKDHNEDFVEISDSDSEEEPEELPISKEVIGIDGAKLLEEQLADMINMTWEKFKMDDRLKETEDTINLELDRLDKESKEIDTLLTECQYATDKLRNDFYGTFEKKLVDLPAIVIFDTPNMQYESLEEPTLIPPTPNAQPETVAPSEGETRQSKRRLSSAPEQQQPAKKPAIPLGYTPLDNTTTPSTPQEKESKSIENVSPGKIDDDNADVSVVKLSAESAPDWLPPTGEIVRSPVHVGMAVYAMKNAFGSWMKAKVVECQPKSAASQFTMCRVKFDHKVKNPCKQLPARCIAYPEPAEFRMTIGTRVIALFKDDSNSNKVGSYYSGVVAEIPNPVNNYRYLVFFDDGYAQYVQHSHTMLVCECSPLVWEEVHPFSREFVRQYLRAYPERPMVRLHAGQSLKTEWNGKWWVSRVIKVDASLVQVHFEEDDRTEWIYRGSTRLAPLYLELQAAERHRARPLPRSTSNKAQPKANMPYVEYTRSDEQGNEKPVEQPPPPPQNEQDGRRQRAVAKKSTASATQPVVTQPPNADTVTSRVVYYTPKNAVKPYKMVPHACGPKCKRTDVLALKDLRTYNPLAKPLLSGWERQIVRYKGYKQVMYRAPCGRRVRSIRELHTYLRLVHSDMSVDLFDFGPNTHCLAEFVLNKCIVSKKDLSHGKENVPVPCVNYYDDSLPEFCLYNTERTPTEGVPLNTDPEFLCGCDCTDDCEDKTKCACWQLTLEGARTIGYEADDDVGYVYRRLPEPLPSGIYECNSRCKCKNTCLNRVAQHPLQLKLQVFKTLNRGWGIRALNDVPKGSFLCVYAGNLLTDATANLDGLNEGDEYLAELDYIEVVEQMKEGYEEDIPEADKELDIKSSPKKESVSGSSDEESMKNEEDADFRPAASGLQGLGAQEFKKSLRKRDKKKKGDKGDNKKEGADDCITISDDEEVREPSRFMAQAGMGANEFVPKYRSVREHYGKDEACYIMDAKVQGNIGRYLNHSCTPNVFVQNVFVDTHDPRFPWVAFFALSHIRAGTELTWNYNYDVGSVPGKVLYCYCGAPNCRGRLL